MDHPEHAIFLIKLSKSSFFHYFVKLEQIKKLAITASSELSKVDKPIGPCGACRQTLSEYEINQKTPFQVIFMGEVGEIVKTESLLSLLPFSFDSSYL